MISILQNMQSIHKNSLLETKQEQYQNQCAYFVCDCPPKWWKKLKVEKSDPVTEIYVYPDRCRPCWSILTTFISNMQNIGAAQACLKVEHFLETYKGTFQKLLSGFCPLRGGGYLPFPLSFFEHNDCPLRGGVPPVPLRKKIAKKRLLSAKKR